MSCICTEIKGVKGVKELRSLDNCFLACIFSCIAYGFNFSNFSKFFNFSTQQKLGIFSVTFAKVIKISQTQNILKRKIFLLILFNRQRNLQKSKK